MAVNTCPESQPMKQDSGNYAHEQGSVNNRSNSIWHQSVKDLINQINQLPQLKQMGNPGLTDLSESSKLPVRPETPEGEELDKHQDDQVTTIQMEQLVALNHQINELR